MGSAGRQRHADLSAVNPGFASADTQAAMRALIRARPGLQVATAGEAIVSAGPVTTIVHLLGPMAMNGGLAAGPRTTIVHLLGAMAMNGGLAAHRTANHPEDYAFSSLLEC